MRRARLLERGVEPGAEVFEGLLGVFEREVAPVDEQLGVELAHRTALADHLVHAWLRERGLVALVVPVSAVAHHVDDDVLLELLPEFEGEPDDLRARLGVVAVDVEDRRLHRLGDVGRVHGRAREARHRREPDLVVDDDVHGAAHVVAGELREVQRLGHDSLAGECGVAVDEHREHLVVLGVAAPVLLGAGHALDDRVDCFEVARVGGERDVHRTARLAGEVAGRADVVLHVARTLRHVGVELALELAEDLRVRLADDVREHVEPAAVRHAHDDVAHPVGGRGFEQEREHRDERLGAFEAEPFLPEVLGVQEALERFGGVQPAENRSLVVDARLGVRAFHVVLDPGLLVGLLDVHVLDADRACVGVAEHAEDVAQLHAVFAREHRRSGTRGRGPRS